MDVVLPKILSYRYMYFNSHNGDGQTMGCISPVLSFFLLSIIAFNVRYPLRSELYIFYLSLNGASATKCGLWRYFLAPFVKKTSYTEMFTAVFEFC